MHPLASIHAPRFGGTLVNHVAINEPGTPPYSFADQEFKLRTTVSWNLPQDLLVVFEPEKTPVNTSEHAPERNRRFSWEQNLLTVSRIKPRTWLQKLRGKQPEATHLFTFRQNLPSIQAFFQDTMRDINNRLEYGKSTEEIRAIEAQQESDRENAYLRHRYGVFADSIDVIKALGDARFNEARLNASGC